MSNPVMTPQSRVPGHIVGDHSKKQADDKGSKPRANGTQQAFSSSTNVENGTGTSTSSPEDFRIPLTMEQAILTVAATNERDLLVFRFDNPVLATIFDELGVSHNGFLASWLQDSQPPIALIDGEAGHNLDAIKQFIEKFDTRVGEAIGDKGAFWNREQCQAETRYALGGAMQ